MRIEQQAGRTDAGVIAAPNMRAEDTAAAEKDVQVFRIEQSRKADHMLQPTYGKPEQEGATTLEEIRQQAGDLDAVQKKNEMLFAADHTSEKDADQIEKDGYSLTDSDIHTVVTETDKIKLMLAKAGEDISCFGDGLSLAQLAKMAGSPELAQQLSRALEAADLPATEENIAALEETLSMMAELRNPGEGAVEYMLENDLAVNTDNLYRAQFSGSTARQSSELSGEDYEALKSQIEAVIAESGLPVTEETVQWGQWMVGRQIPLTAEHMQAMEALSRIQLPMQAEEFMQYALKGMAEGLRPGQAALTEDPLELQAQNALDVIGSVGDEELEYLAAQGRELTVANLRQARQELTDTGRKGSGGSEGSASYSRSGLDLLTAHRRLEETRLLMTAEANRALLKQGISIDTMPLEELVEALKQQENAYYEGLLAQEGTVADPAQAELFARTSRVVTELADMPAYAMGIRQADETTLQELHEEGRTYQSRLDAAGERYETMMTTPRKDMGDSIQKAFGNVNDILKGLNMEANEANRRAVRILAYNQIEITEEHVLQVKALDEEVQRAFANLKPAVVQGMIREGMNPLDMSLSEINAVSRQLQEEQGISQEEKFSKYLWKLEQNSEISQEERSAYIGIYRLIRQVEKTDGAAIGALWRQGGDITMRNLLTQVRSGRHAAMDYTVDDGFGGMAVREGQEMSITDQIAAGYQQNKIYDIMDRLSPERMTDIMREDAWLDMTPEELAEQLERADAAAQQKVAQPGAGAGAAGGSAGTSGARYDYAGTQVKLLQEAAEAPEEVYRWLDRMDMPATVQNVLAAAEYAKNRNGIFRKIFDGTKHMGNLSEELAAAKEQILEAFGEAVKTPEEMAEAQEKLAETAEKVMKSMLEEADNVTSLDVRQMRLVSGQIALGTAAAKEEQYAIPVLVQGETCNISLKIVRGEKRKGIVDIVFESDRLGQVAAELTPDGDGVKGYVAASSQETTRFLQGHEDVFREAFGAKEEDWSVGFITSEQLDISRFGREHQTRPLTGNEDPVQTSTLYRMAESFIRMVKTLEG